MSKSSQKKRKEKQRALRHAKEKELESQNFYGVNDPTPKLAVHSIIMKERGQK